jgi:hypothetical protein
LLANVHPHARIGCFAFALHGQDSVIGGHHVRGAHTPSHQFIERLDQIRHVAAPYGRYAAHIRAARKSLPVGNNLLNRTRWNTYALANFHVGYQTILDPVYVLHHLVYQNLAVEIPDDLMYIHNSPTRLLVSNMNGLDLGIE